MKGVARVNDKWVGICCCHSDPTCIPMAGFIITGSNDHKSSNGDVGRMLDMVIGYCGHTGYIVTSSIDNKTDSRGKSTVDSQVTGCTSGKIITGDTKHITG